MRRMKRDSFNDMFDQMQKIFNEFQEVGKDLTGMKQMPIDIQQKNGKIIVKADLPGVEKEDINLKADKETLTITAESKEEIKEENEKYLRRERTSRSYRRKINWPAKIEPETITARYEEGVLTVEAQKKETEGRDIEIE